MGVTIYPHAQAANVSGVPTPTPPHCAPSVPAPVAGPFGPAPTTSGTLFINEVLSNPHAQWNCDSTSNSQAWIEIYNAQNQPIGLYASHAFIQAIPSNVFYYLPFGSRIAAHGFLVVFPTGQNIFPPNGASGELHLLVNSTMLDDVAYPALSADQSYARIPDGSNNKQVTNTPTIGASNNLPQPTPTPTAKPIPPGHKIGTTTTSGTGRGYGYAGTGQGYSSSGASLRGGPTPRNYGKQPAWSQLQLPGQTLAASTATTPVATSSSPGVLAPPTHGLTALQKIMLTIAAIILAGAPLWGGKLFLIDRRIIKNKSSD